MGGTLHEIPPSVIFSWPAPNYVNPETRGKSLIVIDTLFPALSLIVILFRFYTRIFIKHWFGLDDILILFAWCLDVALGVIVNISVVKYGWDRHLWDIPFKDSEQSEKMAYIARVIYPTALVLIQLSLLYLYYRLIKDVTYRVYRIALYLITIWVITTYTICFFMNIFICIPVNTYWKFPPAVNPKCLDEQKLTMAGAITNNISDLFVTIFPIPLVMRLNLPRTHMIITLCLFGLGFIASVASILRTYFLYRALYKTYDISWMIYPLYTVCAIEVNLGIICCSIPVCRPLLDKTWNVLHALGSKARSTASSERSRGRASNRSQTAPPSSAAGKTDDMEIMKKAPHLTRDHPDRTTFLRSFQSTDSSEREEV